ncbi:MAG: DUF3800 domain-containing protein [Candidatus Sulfotelmatobacter sp.]
MPGVWFYCDESYDSQAKDPNTYVVGGIAAEEIVWEKVERGWSWKNRRVGVKHFHASHLNAHDHEFTGWTKQRAKRYSRGLLKLLIKQKRKLQAVSVGVLAREYEKIINEDGRRRLGNPYILCFKECIALLAEELHRPQNMWPKDVQFSVILEQNRFQAEAIGVFYKMKSHPTWRAAYRLSSCAAGNRDEFIALQAADLIAYETFRLIHERHFGMNKVRKPLEKMFPFNGFSGFYYVPEILERMKTIAEKDTSEPNGCIIIHPPAYTADDAPGASDELSSSHSPNRKIAP